MAEGDGVAHVTGDAGVPAGVRVEKIDHVGIAVRRIDDELAHYRDVLGLERAGEYVVADQKVKAAFLKVGGSTLELLEPTSPDSTIAKFLEKRRPGLHHLAYRVADIAVELARLRDDGVRLIDASPRTGAGGARIAFLHPEATGGVLTELVERHEGHP